ncbi:MAG: hypothetical protein ABIC40_01400 [bacterium]
MSRRRISSLLVLVSLFLFVLGCSGNSPVAPSHNQPLNSQSVEAYSAANGGRVEWGQWQLVIDTVNASIEAVPLRSMQLHFNVVPLLKEGSKKSLLKFSNLLFDPSKHTVQIDISLTHPYASAPQVAGFDVRGILFTRGDTYLLNASSTILPGQDEPRLLNADGYTRWWNPMEFPGGSLLGYVDGYYGTPNLDGQFYLTLAGYKYFADGLGATESLANLDLDDRGVFRAGITNTRRYLIDWGTTANQYLIFNYAVDASWGLIPGWTPASGPPVVPDDFPLTSNCPEPWGINVTETTNTLVGTTAGGTSGTIDFSIDVYDWQALDPLSTVSMEVSSVEVEAPIFGNLVIIATPIPGSGGDGQVSTYEATFTGSSPDKLGYVDFVVTASCPYGDYQNSITNFQGTGPLQAFFVYRATVQDGDPYSGWTKRYSKILYPEYPNQGFNNSDIAVYPKSGGIRAAMVDQKNLDPDHEGGHQPDSINEWSNDYTYYSVPEHYHLTREGLSDTGLWDDIKGITVSDSSMRFFFTNTNIHDEFASGETDPLYCYLTWQSHTYLGNAQATAWLSVFFSAGDYPRMWCTDPCNGVKVANDYIYCVFLYDSTGMGGGDPGANPSRYICFRWNSPYDFSADSPDWQKPWNVNPNGTGTGFVDYSKPYDHRLAVDDIPAPDRFYILDSLNEIEVVDLDFSAVDEFSGSWPIGTVTTSNWPVEISRIVDIEVVQTKNLGTVRNQVAALCQAGDTSHFRIWVFDYDQTQPVGSQAVTQWLSDTYDGTPLALDAADNPIEVHVLSSSGGMVSVSVFRDYP